MEQNGLTKAKKIGFVLRLLVVAILALGAVGAATFAWYSFRAGTAAYAPIFSPEALYIGAGHRDVDEDIYEDIRYLYFNGLDAEGSDYVDKVFCVYGKGVGAYKIQLAYTTNNSFRYEIFHAAESQTETEGSVQYITHQVPAQAYYYSANGEAIAGTFLNKTVEAGRDIATDANHASTYGTYTHVHKNAEPIYWQTSSAETGNVTGDFVNYYLLRIYKNGKATNDRETDVLCIAAKAVTVHGQED
ncbi:MAG TPA: hypothetical protein DCG79_02075 [Clostridiales bacterium]|nr:hypothetical protein [Clostridiales bacterium]